MFVARDRHRPIGDVPIVVGMDGSPKSFGALRTALDIGHRLEVPVHVVAAYDTYYHYVAFNKIGRVLDEEAGKVFRIKEQEQLHEELIDDGIARIYQAHLNVAQSVAGAGGEAKGVQQSFERLEWSAGARELIDCIADPSLCENIGLRAEKSARRDASEEVRPGHVRPFMEDAEPVSDGAAELTWRAAPLARLQRVPEAFRAQVRISVEGFVP